MHVMLQSFASLEEAEAYRENVVDECMIIQVVGPGQGSLTSRIEDSVYFLLNESQLGLLMQHFNSIREKEET